MKSSPARIRTRAHPFLRYAFVRLAAVLATVVARVFVMVIVANLGGYVDEVVRADLAFGLGMSLRDDPRTKGKSAEERVEIYNELYAGAEEAAGLNQPFLLRTARWMVRALALDWGQSRLTPVMVGAERPVTCRLT